MGLLDSLKHSLVRTVKSNVNKGANTLVGQIGKAVTNKTEKFIFARVPGSLEELRSLPEADLKTPFKTAALTVLALMNYEDKPEETIRMLDFLNGPEEVNPYQRQFLDEHLKGQYYKVVSFFDGAVPSNNYTAKQPLTIRIFSNAYSYPEENWAILWLTSGGADSPRGIKLRLKPSTGEWFASTTYDFLAEMRPPVKDDPWA